MVYGNNVAVVPSQYSQECVEAQAGFMKGKILTVIDAAIQEPRQNKAVKDLVHSAIREYCERLHELHNSRSLLEVGHTSQT